MPSPSAANELIAKTVGALEDAAIPCMLIGGQAIARVGEPRFTKDVDLTLGVDPSGFAEVSAIATRLGMKPVEFRGMTPEQAAKAYLLFPVFDPHSKMVVDFIFTLEGFERLAIQRAERLTIGGKKVRVASAEDLVVLKTIAGRPQDIRDIEGILLRNRSLDTAYIRKWLDAYSRDLAEPFNRRFEEILERVTEGTSET